MAALDAGYDIVSSGVTLDRFCGSGITTVNLASAAVMSGMEDLVVAGGTEMMSFTAGLPHDSPFMDRGNERLRALHPQSHQGVCADAIASLEKISRADVDALALESQKRAARAIEGGYFKRSVVPVFNPDGSLALDHEQFPRPQTTAEGLAALKPSFAQIADYQLDEQGTTYRKLIQQKHPGLEITHIHHAGNSSGVVDGAAALLIASPRYAAKRGIESAGAGARLCQHGRFADPDAQCAGSGGEKSAATSRPHAAATSTCGKSTKPSRWSRRSSFAT